MRYSAFIPFKASSGHEYELTVAFDDAELLGSVPIGLEEDERGRIFPVIRGIGLSTEGWESLSEMTHALKIEITSWGSDRAN